MNTAKHHHNKPLIGLADGKKLGEIKDLYLDSGLNIVAAVFVGAEGLIKRKSLAIKRAAVQVIGVDAWLVSGDEPVVDLSTLPESDKFVSVNSLRGREIHTEGGTKIGSVDDVMLDASANVLGFTLGKVFVQGPLAERKTIARAALTDVGGQDSPMITTMGRAESAAIPSTERPAAAPPPEPRPMDDRPGAEKE